VLVLFIFDGCRSSSLLLSPAALVPAIRDVVNRSRLLYAQLARGRKGDVKANGTILRATPFMYFELQRVIRRTVRRLNRLTENKLLVSEWDVLPLDEEGERRSVFDVMEGKIPSPDEEAMRKEGTEAVEKFRREFRAFLGKDEELQGVYTCLCGEIISREEVGKRLGTGVEAIKNARSRLERRLVEFGNQRPDCASKWYWRRWLRSRGAVGQRAEWRDHWVQATLTKG